MVQTLPDSLSGTGKGLAEVGDPLGVWLQRLPEASRSLSAAPEGLRAWFPVSWLARLATTPQPQGGSSGLELLPQEGPIQLPSSLFKGQGRSSWLPGHHRMFWKVRGEHARGSLVKDTLAHFLSAFVKSQLGAGWAGTEAPDASWFPLGTACWDRLLCPVQLAPLASDPAG